ncbi:intraflagellar transport-associated protein [Pleurodeles waltl]|uniref:intraflagellar transport-associated protein n=1 Tax=Pleurodeles waltl TaxID=8319 RepID=UPI0037097D73
MPEGSTEGYLACHQNAIMEEDKKIQEVLDQFLSSHEQTYKEFLNGFTHLSTDTENLSGWTSDSFLLENSGSSAPQSCTSKVSEMKKGLSDSTTMTTLQPTDEEQILIDADRRVGGCNLDDLSLAGRLKVDNFFTVDTDEADEEMAQMIGAELLPGEAEDEVKCYVPSITRRTQLQLRTLPETHRSNQKTEESTRDDVEPFCLDQNFDYDSVVLTPKYTKAEMKTMAEARMTSD